MANFSESPNYVHERPAEFNVEISEGESLHQTTYKLDSNAIRKYELHFGNVAAADRNTIRDHYDGQYGAYASFSWTNRHRISIQVLRLQYDMTDQRVIRRERLPLAIMYSR